MAELYWAWQKYDLSEAAENIGDVYGALAQEMQRQGWSGVQHQEDVHGFKSGIDLFAIDQRWVTVHRPSPLPQSRGCPEWPSQHGDPVG